MDLQSQSIWYHRDFLLLFISFKSDSALLIYVFFWSDIGVILSPNSLGIAYQMKKQLRDKPIIA